MGEIAEHFAGIPPRFPGAFVGRQLAQFEVEETGHQGGFVVFVANKDHRGSSNSEIARPLQVGDGFSDTGSASYQSEISAP
jgi:hypothetical protein